LANLGKKKFRIITSDIDPLLPGVYRGDQGYLVPKKWEEFIPTLNKIIAKEKIDIIIPGSDLEIDYLSPRRDHLKAPILLANKEKIEIVRDKWNLAEWLRKKNYPHPKTYLGIPLFLKFPNYLKFPLILKPRKDWGSNDIFKVENQEQLEIIKKLILSKGFKEKDYITQECLSGTELSGMAFIAKDREILSINCAESIKKFGMSYKTIHGSEEDYLDFKLLVAKTVGRMGITGPVSVQAFRNGRSSSITDKPEIRIFEINPRFTGAQIVRALGGVNGPELLIENWLEGKKAYPTIKAKFVALWYSDYLYLPLGKYYRLKTLGFIEKSGKGVKLL